MKKNSIVFLTLMFCAIMCCAQNKSVFNSLQQTYTDVSYHSDGPGWYLGSYVNGGYKYYAVLDSKGNVICKNVVKYEPYESWIKVQYVDPAQVTRYDKWKKSMQEYEKSMGVYNSIISEYNESVREYNTKVEAAKREATRLYNAKIKQIRQQIEAERKVHVLSSGLEVQELFNDLKYERLKREVKYGDYLNAVLGNWDLLVAPRKPNVSAPSKPEEPRIDYIWKNYTYIQPCPFEEINFDLLKTKEGRTIAKKDGKYGYIDSKLKCILPFQYEDIKLSNGYLVCKKNGMYGVYNTNGELKHDFKYKNVVIKSVKSNTVLLTQTDDGCGACDFASGNILIPDVYDWINFEQLDSTKTCFTVQKNGLCGVLSVDNKVLLPCKFNEAKVTHLSNTHNFYITVNNKKGLYDVNGKEYLSPGICKKWEYIVGEFFKYQTNDLQYGVIGLDGETILEPIYEEIEWNHTLSAFIVSVSGKKGVYSANGKTVVPLFSCRSLNWRSEEKVFTFGNSEKEELYGACDIEGNIIIASKKKWSTLQGKLNKIKNDTEHSERYEKVKKELRAAYQIAKSKQIP